jgi:putative membrane protein
MPSLGISSSSPAFATASPPSIARVYDPTRRGDSPATDPAARVRRSCKTARVRLLINLVVALLINLLALWIADGIFGSFEIGDASDYILAAAVLGIANAVLKPILALLTLPLILVTLGLFYLVINIAMVALTEWIVPNFSVDGFWTYVGVVVIVWLVNWAANAVIDRTVGDAR